MRGSSSFVRAAAAVLLVAFFAFGSYAAFGQTAQPTQPTRSLVASPPPSGAVPASSPSAGGSPKAVATKPPGPPASYYASYGLIAIGVLTVIAMLGGYLFQAPGFRRSRGGSAE